MQACAMRVGMVRHVVGTHWMLFALFAAMGVAVLEPDPGARMYELASRKILALIFFLVGSSLELDEMRHALLSFRVHVFCQSFSLLFTPLAYFALVHSWGLDSWLLTPDMATGMMVTLAMPTTTSTGVVMTEQAGGCATTAAVNAALGNLVGPLVSPLMVGLLCMGSQRSFGQLSDVSNSSAGANGGPLHSTRRGSRRDTGPTPAKLLQLFALIVLPLLSGLALQLLLRRLGGATSPAAAVRRHMSRLLRLVIVCLFYLLFSTAFHSGSTHHSPLSPRLLLTLLVFVSAVQAVLIAAAWALSSVVRLEPAQRVAFCLMGPQKTESKAFALLSILFGHSDSLGAMLLPVVCYHTVQMLISALLAQPLRDFVARARTVAGQLPKSRSGADTGGVWGDSQPGWAHPDSGDEPLDQGTEATGSSLSPLLVVDKNLSASAAPRNRFICHE